MRSLRIAFIALMLTIIGTQITFGQSLPPEVAETVQTSVVRIKSVSNDDRIPNRVATGFIWPEANFVVTAFHVVAGADTILVEQRGDTIRVRNAQVVGVLLEQDLALLELDDPFPSEPLNVHADSVLTDDMLWVVGYPLNLLFPRSRRLHQSAIAATELQANLNPDSRQQIRELGYPALDIEVLPLEGNLLPGDSGAPIINADGEVVGIGSGGLELGTVGLGWAIPARYLATLRESLSDEPIVSAVEVQTIGRLYFAQPASELVEEAFTAAGIQLPERLVIFRNADLFIIHIPEDSPSNITLEGLQLQVDAELGVPHDQLLSDYQSLSADALRHLQAPSCLIFRRGGTRPPIPDECGQQNTIAIIDLVDQNVFWHDNNFVRDFTVQVVSPNGISGSCGANIPRCDINLSLSSGGAQPSIPTETVDTPRPTEAPTTIAAPPASEITIIRTENDLFILVDGGDRPVSLSTLVFQTTGESEIPFSRYSSFAQRIANITEPVCFWLKGEGSTTPLPLECDPASLEIQELNDTNIFWHDDVSNQDFTFGVSIAGGTTKFCGAGNTRCDIDFSS